MSEDNKCHQCKSDHDVGEIHLRSGLYSVDSQLCREHQEAMVKHFDELLKTRANAVRP